MQDGNAKQRVVEQIKNATNILVTVSANPSVDELAAALSFTLMLNKMDKRATAVFSGTLPAAISFLKPDKTFENSVDSLRDFIIALDKEKADRLRYKVENDVVRVFITPYKTTITEKDLQFSQGDFNVELIVALGVEKRDDLDKAIVAHGRILHDATIVTINTKKQSSSLGGIDWQDGAASSYCEMLMGLSEALKPDLLDEQIATALLTGIVAATERFSNPLTTPRVMTMSAQLMAAGANQQLIAVRLQQPEDIPMEETVAKVTPSWLKEGVSHKVEKEPLPEIAPIVGAAKADSRDTAADFAVPKENQPVLSSSLTPSALPDRENEANTTSGYDVEKELTEKLNAQLPPSARALDLNAMHEEMAKESAYSDQQEAFPASPFSAPETLSSEVTSASTLPAMAPVEEPVPSMTQIIHDEKPAWVSAADTPPELGSPLSATSQQALEDAKKEREYNKSHTLLSHPEGNDDAATADSSGTDTVPQSTNSIGLDFEEAPLPFVQSETSPAPEPQVEAPAPIASQNLNMEASQAAAAALQAPPQATASAVDIDQARQAVHDALMGGTFEPTNQPVSALNAQELGVIDYTEPSMASAAPAPPAPAPMPMTQTGPQESQIAMPPVLELPPLPDFSSLPPLPDSPPENTSPFVDPVATLPVNAPTAPAPADSAPVKANPAQYRIPGQ